MGETGKRNRKERVIDRKMYNIVYVKMDRFGKYCKFRKRSVCHVS